MKDSIAQYYNQYAHQLLNDYIKNNKRVYIALKAITILTDTFKPSKILDLGCGIGWSSFEISRQFPNIKIEGYDLSPDLISIGKEIFNSDNLDLNVKDLTESEDISSEKFEFICMIDVFEHIPRDSRKHFGESLKKNLGGKFMIFFSCPTISMQNYLKATNPSAIQPVDEDIDKNVLKEFAEILNGHVVFYKEINVGQERDYLHAVIANSSEKIDIDYASNKFNFEKRSEKIKRILWSTQKKYLSRQNLTTRLEAKFYELLNLH